MTTSLRHRRRYVLPSLLALLALSLSALWLAFPYAPGRLLVEFFTPTWEPEPGASRSTTTLGGEQVTLTLERVGSGFTQPTDIQFVPGHEGLAIVLQKTGSARLWSRSDGKHEELFALQVSPAGEQGLLGLAFHPRFVENGKFYLNYVREVGSEPRSRVAEWSLPSPADPRKRGAKEQRVLLDVAQPYSNHNAGQLAFGPDGFLYVGYGDGGLRDDPHGHGQNTKSFLGSILRIDVDRKSADKPYGIPEDNPFVSDERFAPEIWAYGLRNPWRYSFDPLGRLVVADVGQDAWEEISLVQAGDNLGWDVMEGFVCADGKNQCTRDPSFVDPIYVYGRDVGRSITGGYVYTASRLSFLRDHYVFGDFVSGRLLALRLPRDRKQRVEQAVLLGKWPILPVAFGRDASGELYVADFKLGDIYRIEQAHGP